MKRGATGKPRQQSRKRHWPGKRTGHGAAVPRALKKASGTKHSSRGPTCANGPAPHPARPGATPSNRASQTAPRGAGVLQLQPDKLQGQMPRPEFKGIRELIQRLGASQKPAAYPFTLTYRRGKASQVPPSHRFFKARLT
jgi:hypothetical protein